MGRKLDRRWECLSQLSNPDEVTLAHLKKFYRLEDQACPLDACRSMCKGNTRCLNHITDAEEVTIPSEDVEEFSDNVNDIVLNRSGLRNYGSTCYLNAFLQIYFHFAELRQAIYQLPYNQSFPEGVVEQLQLIFSQMQLSREGLVDPGGLIEALHLSERDQQDAPEFHSLFMSLLETRFSSVGQTVIRDLFQGSCVYETRCQICGFVSRLPSQFLELDIKVATGRLEEYIQKYLAEEELTGDNQYACPQCATKRDGSRRVRITATPLMLCIQLLRFNYDQRLGRRVKQAAPVRLPDLLDMTPYISPEDPSSPTENNEKKRFLYRCSGVLLHLGRYSTSGHYIAVVRCSDADKDFWKVCNDERVFTVPVDEFDLSKVNTTATSATSVRSTPKKPASVSSKPAPMVIDSDTVENDNTANVDGDNVYHVSPSAYMVFYRLVEADDAPMNNGPAMEVDVPDHLRRVVDATNVVFTMENLNRRLEKIEQKQLTLGRIILRRYILEHLRTVTGKELLPRKRRKPNSSVTSNDDANDVVNSTVNVVDSIGDDPDAEDSTDADLDDICIVPTWWLAEWLNEPQFPPPQLHFPPHDKDVFVEAREFVGALPLFCTHNRISPNVHSQHIRAVSRSGLSLCFNLSLDLDNCEVIAPDSVSSPFTSIEAVAALSPCIGCLRWRVAVKGFNKECNALTKDISRWRRASKGGVWPLVPGAESAVSSSPSRVYFLGMKSFTNWRSFAQTYFCAAAKASSCPPTTDFNKDAVCPHNHLLADNIRCLPPSLWHRIVALFTLPNSTATATIPEYPSDCCDLSPCLQCADVKENLLARAQNEREALSGILTALTSGSSQRQLDGLITGVETELAEANEGNRSIYLVPTEFIQQWRRYLRLPAAIAPPVELPSGLEAAGVLCIHECLQMPWNELLEDNLVYPLSSYEWHAMSQFYSVTSDHRPLRLVALPNDEKQEGMDQDDETGTAALPKQQRFSLVGSPEVCDECYALVQQRRCNFVAARIFIRQVAGPAEALAFNSTSPASSTSLEQTTSSIQSPTREATSANAAVVRRSQRRRVSREDSILRVNSFTKLIDLRVQLINVVGAAPYDQHILLDGVELTDNTSSLYQLGIRPETRLLVWIDTPNSEAIAEASKKPPTTPSSSANNSFSPADRQVETGFKGTRLLDYWSPDEKNSSLSGVS
ncbi:Ubiquitin hydrolase [Echinococcus granulosus]|uniref:ubiquitinyl hydrolase 1 n=1 Tax=Echinococcus granulosus TaxID=6210 RepID=W6V1J7_ECHGR|nr:Ubiquitin hydrolase [Echinococcus granulosus]EUB59739.1 Ubiquitin hydrolase [Echinococcus granulosus]